MPAKSHGSWILIHPTSNMTWVTLSPAVQKPWKLKAKNSLWSKPLMNHESWVLIHPTSDVAGDALPPSPTNHPQQPVKVAVIYASRVLNHESWFIPTLIWPRTEVHLPSSIPESLKVISPGMLELTGDAGRKWALLGPGLPKPPSNSSSTFGLRSSVFGRLWKQEGHDLSLWCNVS